MALTAHLLESNSSSALGPRLPALGVRMHQWPRCCKNRSLPLRANALSCCHPPLLPVLLEAPVARGLGCSWPRTTSQYPVFPISGSCLPQQPLICTGKETPVPFQSAREVGNLSAKLPHLLHPPRALESWSSPSGIFL